MDKRFRYFEQVASLGSIRQAAEQLNTAPSSVSRQIAHMEREYGVALLVRHAGGVRLTPAGEAVVRFLRGQARDYKRLQAAIQELTTLRRGQITIHTVEGTVDGLLPETLARFCADHPGITYEVCIAGTDDVMRAVAEDRCDIGISFHPHAQPEVETLLCIRQPLLAVVAPGHHLAGRAALTLADLRGEPVGIPDRSFGIRHLVDHVARKDQVEIDIRLETNCIDMVRQFAVHGMGVAFLPAFSFEREVEVGSLCGVPFRDPDLAAATLQICKRRDAELFLPAARFVDYLTCAVLAGPGVA